MYVYVLISLILVTSAIASPPAVTLYTDRTIVNGSLLDADHSLGSVRFLGVLNTTKDCMKACLNVGKYRCTSFTYYNSDYVDGGYTKHCYGIIDNPVWSLQDVMNAETGRILWPCRNDMDCSLNGECESAKGKNNY